MHCVSSYTRAINGQYDAKDVDDLVSASGEEDLDGWAGSPFNHFWNPDYPFILWQDSTSKALYGSSILWADSSYRKAVNYWQTKVIPLYLKGDVNQSYYWLGRTSHLLEDAAQPSHVHLDTHLPFLPWEKSTLEGYTADNLKTIFATDYNWQGKNYFGKQYDYTNLIPGFNWDSIKPGLATDRLNIELFNLFWYTAEKTQYFASDDVDGNMVYTRTDNNQTTNFNCNLGSYNNLWYKENLDCSHIDSNHDAYLSEPLVKEIADDMIPHAMKANGALFQLFWDTVNSYSWPTFHGNNQRTGYSFLKGDLQTATNKKEISYNGKSATDFLDSPAFGNLDNDSNMEIVVGTTRLDAKNGRVFAVDDNGKEMWSTTKTLGINNTIVAGTPEIADLDNDGKNEVIFGDRAGRLFVLDGVTGMPLVQMPALPLGIYGENRAIFATAIADINNSGKKSIVLSEFIIGSNTLAKLHAYSFGKDSNNKFTLTQLWETTIGVTNDSSGSQYHPAIANIDQDAWPEIIIDSFTQVYAFDGKTGALQWNRSMGMNFGSPVIADLYQHVISQSFNHNHLSLRGIL